MGFSWQKLPLQLALVITGFLVAVIVFVPQIVATMVLSQKARQRLFNQGGAEEFDISVLDFVRMWFSLNPAKYSGTDTNGLWHWLIAILTLIVLITVVCFAGLALYRLGKDPQRKKGLAPDRDVARYLHSEQLVKNRALNLRPSLDAGKITPKDVGYFVGDFRGRKLYLTVEDPTIIVGPSRAGKGWFLILNWIIDAPGAVITTSSKMDNLLLTLKQKERSGSKCFVFAPGMKNAHKIAAPFLWDPVTGCTDEETLVRRIKALIPSDSFSGSTSNGGHWDTLGQQLAAHLFHAAACGGFDVNKVWEWVTNPQRAIEAVNAIRAHPEGLLEHASHLETVLNMPVEQRVIQWGVLPTVLAFLESRSARYWMLPQGEGIDLVDFILNKGCLYLVGDKQTSGGYVRLIDAVLAEIDYVTKGLADVSKGSRLDPPVSYILDEAGNFEYQGLYELITAGGGRGRVCHAVFQSRSQLAAWGQENVETLWDAATAKIVLPGGADPKALQEISQLVGQMWTDREQYSYNGQGLFNSVPGLSISQEKRSILEASEIRELEAGYALLFYRNLKPVIPKLQGFDKHPAYSQCLEDAKELTARLVAHSPFSRQVVKSSDA